METNLKRELIILSKVKEKPLSAPVKWLKSEGLLRYKKILDYCCGTGKDAEVLHCHRYDPVNAPKMPRGKYEVILSTYSLDRMAINKRVVLKAVIDDIQMRLKKDGKAYVTVRRDTKDTDKLWLSTESLRKTSGYEIYVISKTDRVEVRS